jgi:hypothetical protein
MAAEDSTRVILRQRFIAALDRANLDSVIHWWDEAKKIGYRDLINTRFVNRCGTPLLISISHPDSQYAITKFLIDEGAEISSSVYIEKCIHAAAKKQDSRFLELLITQGVSVNSPCLGGSTPLHAASGWGCLENVKLLIKYNCNINPTKTDWSGHPGETPLYSAVEGGYSQVIYFLLKHGADPDIRSRETMKTPLDCAEHYYKWLSNEKSHEEYRKIVEMLTPVTNRKVSLFSLLFTLALGKRFIW